MVRKKKSGIDLAESRVNSILLLNAKKEWPNQILNPQIRGTGFTEPMWTDDDASEGMHNAAAAASSR